MCLVKKNKSIFIISAYILSIFSSSNAFAATKVSSEGLLQITTCTVNVQSAILQTNEGKAAKLKIEKEAEKDRQDILAKQNQLKKMDEEFQAQQSILSDSDKLAKQKEFQVKLQEFQKSQMSFEQKTRNKELAATQEIYQKIKNIVKEAREQNKCTMTFDDSAGVLLDAVNLTDITIKVVEKYNTKYKVENIKSDNKKKG
ncbi:OmpH family outer membrane protein [Silvanigrella aquatica]|uniref:Uncharacterized protein n=1 Tax=Silvanigrella aquatica TaxID=1915309 RepID=A0A1L4D3S2_9BACT|nr:OmpH family outer membrane protein [Silvanigrella aquatica]APJ04830.1 hypothetical protein AXG55_13345 [Silvanigrella aquatica]